MVKPDAQNQEGRAQESPPTCLTAFPLDPFVGVRQNSTGGEPDRHRGIAARFAYPSFFINPPSFALPNSLNPLNHLIQHG